MPYPFRHFPAPRTRKKKRTGFLADARKAQLASFKTLPVTMEGVTLKYDCPSPNRATSDEYRCPLCGIVWGVDEAKPPCQRTDVHTSNRS